MLARHHEHERTHAPDVGLLRLLREDWEAHERSVSRAGFQALAIHRLRSRCDDWPTLARIPARLVLRLAYVFVRNVYGIEIPRQAVLGRRVQLAHQGGIVLNEFARVGDDCLIRHDVTIGARDDDRWDEAPTIGNDVRIGPGAVITGRITVGDGVRIGPNSVVVHDVPAGARVLAPVATIRPPRPPDVHDRGPEGTPSTTPRLLSNKGRTDDP